MAESEGIQEILNQAALQVATVVMMALRGMDVGSHLAPTANLRATAVGAWQTGPRRPHLIGMGKTGMLNC